MPVTMPLEEISTTDSCRAKLEEYTRVCKSLGVDAPSPNDVTKDCI